MSSLFPQPRASRRGLGALVALVLVSLASSGISQQPFQVPTALAASSGLPIETVGTRMLVRRNVTGGSELGFLNGVTSAAFNLTCNVTEAAKVFGVHLERGVTTPANVFISYLPGS